MNNEQLVERVDKLEKENEQLKQSIKDLACTVKVLWDVAAYGNCSRCTNYYQLFKVVTIDTDAFEYVKDKLFQIMNNLEIEKTE